MYKVVTAMYSSEIEDHINEYAREGYSLDRFLMTERGVYVAVMFMEED